MIIKTLRLLLLIISMYGYTRLFSKRMRTEFALGFTCTCIGSAMFFAGILNILLEMAIALFTGGFLCLAYSLKTGIRRRGITAGVVFFIVISAFIFRSVYGVEFTHYDNFSHWALMVKHLMIKKRFPNYSDTIFSHISYPPGASAFIYYFVLISGIKSEWFQMFVQSVCMAGLISGLFCLAETIPGKLICSACSVILLSAICGFDQLLVDTLLPITAISAIAFCVYYRNTILSKSVYLIPWLIYLTTQKNSGLFFAFFIIALVVILAKQRKNGMITLASKKWGIIATITAVPLTTLLLWQKHIAYVIPNGLESRHAMSMTNYIQIFNGKDTETIRSIIKNFTSTVFSWQNEFCLIFVFSVVLLCISRLLSKNSTYSRIILVYGIACYLIYQMGNMAMYIFSMPGGEDLRLAGYYRYNRTIVIFSGGATVISLCMLLNQIKGSLKCFIYSILCCIACIGSFHFSGLPHYEYYKAHYSTGSTLSTAFREKLQPLIDQYGIPTGARVIIFLDDGINDASGLLSYIAKYSLFTSVADTKWITNMNDSVNLNSFDYLIAIGESDDMTNFMREQFGTEKRVIDLSTINEM